MAKRRISDKSIAIIAIALFLGSWQLGFLTQFGLEPFVLPGNILGGTTEKSPLSFNVYKEGTTTAIASVAVYAWYDWDGDGAVDLGAYPADGEIESLVSAATTGLVTTSVEYPIGKDVLFQCQVAAYEINTFARSRDSVPAAHDGSALSVPNVFLRANPEGQAYCSESNTGNLVTATEYAGATYGFSNVLDIKVISNTTDTGFSEGAYTDWDTGYEYSGNFVGITLTNQDFIDSGISGGYDGMFVGASNTMLWMWIGNHFDNDADTGDGSFILGQLEFTDMTADWNMTIGIHSSVKMTALNVGSFGTGYEVNGVNAAVGAPVTIGLDYS